MRIKEVSEKYNVAISTLRYYEKVGLFEDVNRVNGIREYEDRDIERLSLILSLKTIGLNIETISRFIKLTQNGNQTIHQRIDILKNERQRLLDDIHRQQKALDSLDAYLYQMKKYGG